MIKLSIIIVNYNAKDYLRDCLYSLVENINSDLTYEIIVVDNSSSDSSLEMLKKEFPKVILIENTNEGFAKANNKGVLSAKGKYILFLNPDTIVYKQTLAGMYDFMEQHPDAGASTCMLKMANQMLDYSCHRGFPTPWNSFCYFSGLTKLFPHLKYFSGYTQGYKDLNKTHEIDSLAGAFMLTRRIAGDQVGWWDEDYFFNGEDIDFCYRLKKKGWKIYFVPLYTILHYAGVSGGSKKHSLHITTADSHTKRRVQLARFEAMKLFYKKHYAKKYPKLITYIIMKGIDWKAKNALSKI